MLALINCKNNFTIWVQVMHLKETSLNRETEIRHANKENEELHQIGRGGIHNNCNRRPGEELLPPPINAATAALVERMISSTKMRTATACRRRPLI